MEVNGLKAQEAGAKANITSLEAEKTSIRNQINGWYKLRKSFQDLKNREMNKNPDHHCRNKTHCT